MLTRYANAGDAHNLTEKKSQILMSHNEKESVTKNRFRAEITVIVSMFQRQPQNPQMSISGELPSIKVKLSAPWLPCSMKERGRLGGGALRLDRNDEICNLQLKCNVTSPDYSKYSSS